MRERERGRKGVRTKCDKIDTILCWSGPGVGEVKGQTFIFFCYTWDVKEGIQKKFGPEKVISVLLEAIIKMNNKAD